MVRKLGRWLSVLFLMLLTVGASAAIAASVSSSSMSQAGMNADLAQYAAAVSGNEGNWSSVGTTTLSNGTVVRCYGAFQFCDNGTLQRYYNGTGDQFRHDPAAQVTAYKSYMSDNWAAAQRNGLTSAVGKSACWNGKCVTVTNSSILMACQFGCGSSSKLANYVKNGYSCDGVFSTSDGKGTSVCKYLVTGANYNVSAVTGQSNDTMTGTQCLAALTSGQLSLAVPYGTQRTGEGTGGQEWNSHAIGLTSTATTTDGNAPEVLAGIAGNATWHPSSAPGGGSVVITAPDGSAKVTYSGLSGVDAAMNKASPTVSQSQKIGLMTVNQAQGSSSGTPGFNIALELSGAALKAAGLSPRAGDAVPCPTCTTSNSGNSAVGSDKLADAGARTYYYVNPETFLNHAISVSPQAQRAYPQAFTGRSSTSTLPTTCSASPEELAKAGAPSGGTGSSEDGGLGGVAGYRNGSDDFPAVFAAEAERALFSEWSHSIADDLRIKARDSEARDVTDNAVAHLGIIEENKAH